MAYTTNITPVSGNLNASECVSEGWRLYSSHFGIFFAVVLVSLIINAALGYIPYVGWVFQILATGALTCGVYKTMLEARKNNFADFSNLFNSFGEFYVPSTLIYLLMMLPSLAVGAMAGALFGIGKFQTAAQQDPFSIFKSPAFLAIVFAGLLGWLLTMFLSVVLCFAFQLIAEHKIGFKDAVSLSAQGATQNLGGLILLFILEFLIMLGGVLLFCIGILFAMPLVYAANVAAYKRIFPDNSDNQFNAPPQPNYYGSNFGNSN